MKYIQFISLFVVAMPLLAQLNEQDIRARLELIHSGKTEEVRSEIPSLMHQYPNDPGIKYLDAYLTVNGDQAVRKYQFIVDQFPKSEWADDALYKVYKYYYAVGLYKTAEAKMDQLNRQFPNSIYAQKPVNVNEKTQITPPPAEPEKEETKPIVKEEPDSPANQQSGKGPFLVQVGVYSQESTAQNQARQLTTTVGRQAIVFSKLSGNNTVYAVAFEGFYTETSARSFGARLKSDFNIDWFMVKR